MTEVRIAAEPRTEFGKGAARRLRRAELVPGVIYGHGAEVQHISLPAHDLAKALKNSNVLLELELGGTTSLALPKAVQRDPIRPFIEHVDLVTVVRGEKVVVEVPVLTEGKLAPGGLLEHVHDTIAIEAEATHIPQHLTVSLDGVEVGGRIRAGDVPLPAGTTLVADPELTVVHVLAPQAAEVEVEEAVEVAEPAAPVADEA
ncbi:MAG: 50S ribosomal protein L25/general stress protein Ctc [Actinomycetes bacterium]